MHIYGIIEAGAKEVRGLRLRTRRGAGRWHLEHFIAVKITDEAQIPEALSEVYTGLAAGKCDFIVLTGALPGCGCFELYMPRLKPPELEAALEFELPRYLPGGADGMRWSCRVLNIADKTVAKHRVRVFFARKTEWDNFTGELEHSGIKADAFIYPFMAVDPELAALPVYLPEIDAKFYFSAPDVNGLRHMERLDSCDVTVMADAEIAALGCPEDMEPEQTKRCMDGLLAAKYISGSHYGKNGDHGHLPLPPSLYPKRCRVLKRLTAASGLAALVCLALWLGTEWNELHGRYSAAELDISAVKQQLSAEKTFLQKNAILHKTVNKTLTSLPNRTAVLQILCYLASRLPKDIAVNSYNMQGNKVNLTMKCASDPENALAQLSESARYTVENLRKNRNQDGSYYIYLVLAIND